MERRLKQKINPLLKASVFYIIGNGIGQGVILLGTIIFTRIMTQNDYGVYSTYYSLVSILTTLVGANLFIGLNNAYIDYASDIHHFRASVLVLSSLVFSITTALVLLGKIIIDSEISSFIIIMALVHAYAFFVVNYFSYSANMENRYQIRTVFLLLPNILQIVISVLFIYMFPQIALNARITGSALGVVACAVWVYFYMLKGQHKLYNKDFWRYALKISVPSVLSSISYMLMQQFDKVMITKFYNAAETAVYSLVYYVGYILYAVQQATSSAWQVWIYRALDSGDLDNVKKVQKWYLFVFGQMAYGLLMISPEMVKILSPKSYWDFNYIAPFILGSCLMVMYSFDTTVGLFYQKSAKVSLCVFLAAMVNLVLNYLMIPKFGGVAAAYTSVVAYLLLFALSRRMVHKLHSGLFSLKYFMIFFISIIIGCIIFNIIYRNIFLRYIIFLVLLFLSLIYMLFNKKEILGLIKNN